MTGCIFLLPNFVREDSETDLQPSNLSARREKHRFAMITTLLSTLVFDRSSICNVLPVAFNNTFTPYCRFSIKILCSKNKKRAEMKVYLVCDALTVVQIDAAEFIAVCCDAL